MALTPQVESLIAKLLTLSREGKVNWEETADEQKFLAPLTKYVVTVGAEDGYARSYSLEVADQSGKSLETAYASNGFPGFSDLQDLHELARRRALHVDEAISDLLSSLAEIR